MTKNSSPRVDVYTRVTGKIIADLEQGVRPWMKPWNAELKIKKEGSNLLICTQN